MSHRPPLASLTLIALLSASMAVAADDSKDAPALPAKKNFHLYLLAGQSNMAGRGKVEEQDKQPHPRVLALTKDGTWKPAVAPLHWDKSVAGVGLGRTFALTRAEKDNTITTGPTPPDTAAAPGCCRSRISCGTTFGIRTIFGKWFVAARRPSRRRRR